MISRVADHCFWFGRYVERAEATARMIAATSSLSLDDELPPQHCWRPLVVVAGEEATFLTRHGRGSKPDLADPGNDAVWADGDGVARFLTWDDDIGVSLIRSVRGARWNARSIREVLSLDAFEAINELYLWMQSDAARAQWADARDDFYRHVRRMTQLCLGLMRSTMLHDEPLEFIWLGVMLERVSQTARILDVHHHAYAQSAQRHEVVATALWLSLLRALSGGEAFLKRFGGRVDADQVAAFLLHDAAFPRSIAFCAHAALDRLNRIRPPDQGELPGGAAHRQMAELVAWFDSRSRTPEIHEVLTRVVDETHAICGELSRELLVGT